MHIMMRPSDQAKLLFLYLLRSSSALATRATTNCATTASAASASTSSTATGATAASKSIPPTNSHGGLEGHISLRLATRLDVPSIQRCNLASLPENYSSNFYVNHIRNFPDLALVAEHVPPPPAGSKNNGLLGDPSQVIRRNPFENYNPSVPESNIIGYVLGKIENPRTPTNDEARTYNSFTNMTPLDDQRQKVFQPSRVGPSSGNDELDEYLIHQQMLQQQQQQQQQQQEVLGHVTSLAVLKPYRRKGLAALLMKQLHFHMRYGHQATGVGLHVRVSNIAARRLYCEGMGYGVVDVIRGYYADGEDAFFMKKVFDGTNDEYPYLMEDEMNTNATAAAQQQQQQSRSIGSRFPFRRKNEKAVYQNGPREFRLPLIIPLNDDHNNLSQHSSMIDDSSGEDVQVMTGSL